MFLLLKAKSYYAVGLYPILMAFGAVYLSALATTGWKKYLPPAALLLIIVLFIPFFKIGFPNKSPEQIKSQLELYRKFGMLRWEDGEEHHLPQDFADMLGWRELAAKVDAVYDTIQNKNQTLVLCTNYGESGAINYYSKHPNIQAVSFNADYINWFPLDKQIINIISIIESDEVSTEIEDVSPLFDSVTRRGSVENKDAREFGTAIVVLQGAKTDINALLLKEIAERK